MSTATADRTVSTENMMVQTIAADGRHGPYTKPEIVPANLSTDEMLEMSGLDFEVVSRPLYVAHVGGAELVENFVANVREDTDEVLGVVTPTYQGIQNRSAFEIVGAAVERGEAGWVAAGTQREGRRVWAMLKREREFSPLGEKVDPFFLFVNDHTGGHSLSTVITPQRAACTNMLPFLLGRGSTSRHAIRHVGDVNGKLREAETVIAFTDAYFDRFEQVAEKLALRKITERELNRWVQQLWPTDEEGMGDRAIQNRKQAQELVQRLVTEGGPTIDPHRNTAWGYVNAVAEGLDWGRQIPAERRMSRLLDGADERMKNRALAQAMESVN